MFTATLLMAATAPGQPPIEPGARIETRTYSWSWSAGTPPTPDLVPPLALPKMPFAPLPGGPLLPAVPNLLPDPFEPFPELTLPLRPFQTKGVFKAGSTDIRRDGDTFTAKSTDAAGTVEVAGKVVGGIAIPDVVTVRGTDKKAATYKLADLPAGRQAAVRLLLSQVR